MSRRRFFELRRLAVVGNTEVRPFPIELYDELRQLGCDVYPVDLGGSRYVQGDEAFGNLTDLAGAVDGAIIDLPRHSIAAIIDEAANVGIGQLWIQGGANEALQEAASEQKLTLHHGDARLYTRPGFSVARSFLKLFGRY